MRYKILVLKLLTQILTILMRDRIKLPILGGEANEGHALLKEVKNFVEDQVE